MKPLKTALFLACISPATGFGQLNQTTYLQLKEKASKVNSLLTLASENDPWDKAEFVDSCNMKAIDLMLEIFNDEAYYYYDVDKLLETTQTVSSDKSLVIHNIYSNNGGTFRIHYNILERRFNGKRTGSFLSETDQCGSMGHYYKIERIPSVNGRNIYLLLSETMGCSSCYSHEASLIETYGEEIDFSYKGFVNENGNSENCFAMFTRDWENMIFEYDSTTRTVTYSYLPESYEQEPSDEMISGEWKFEEDKFIAAR